MIDVQARVKAESCEDGRWVSVGPVTSDYGKLWIERVEGQLQVTHSTGFGQLNP